MQFTDSSFYGRKRRKDEEIDCCYASVEHVINHVHLMHPFLVHSRIPEELHHYQELCQLRDLTQQYQANIQTQSPLVDPEFSALC